MNKNVAKTVDFLIKKYRVNCEVTNAASFILAIDDSSVSKEKLKLDKFEKEFSWDPYFVNSIAETDNYEDFLEYYISHINWGENI